MFKFILTVSWIAVTVAISKKHKVLLELRQDCRRLLVDVDHYQHVQVEAFTSTPRYSMAENTSCNAFFKTSLPNHGLCVRIHTMNTSNEHVRLEFQTNAFGPDKILQGSTNGVKKFWCFPDPLMSVKISITADQPVLAKASFFIFSVTSQALDSLPREYNMDSFAECSQTHTLTSGQEVSLFSQRQPSVNAEMPEVCALTFTTSSEDEFEQVCLKLNGLKENPKRLEVALHPKDIEEKLKSREKSSSTATEADILYIEGLNDAFYTMQKALEKSTVCSKHKRLTIIFNRTADNTASFSGTVSSRWHPHWETEATEARQLRFLTVVKGFTYFIATIDSLVAVLVAALATIIKRPAGPWKRWAENFNAMTLSRPPRPYPAPSLVDTASHYGSMHACKDGNYPELPAESVTHINEVLVESHTY